MPQGNLGSNTPAANIQNQHPNQIGGQVLTLNSNEPALTTLNGGGIYSTFNSNHMATADGLVVLQYPNHHEHLH